MLIVCPTCSTSYEVTLAALGEKGRSVRCANCKNTWFATPEDAEAIPAMADASAASRRRRTTSWPPPGVAHRRLRPAARSLSRGRIHRFAADRTRGCRPGARFLGRQVRSGLAGRDQIRDRPARARAQRGPRSTSATKETRWACRSWSACSSWRCSASSSCAPLSSAPCRKPASCSPRSAFRSTCAGSCSRTSGARRKSRRRDGPGGWDHRERIDTELLEVPAHPLLPCATATTTRSMPDRAAGKADPDVGEEILRSRLALSPGTAHYRAFGRRDGCSSDREVPLCW